MIRTMMLGVLGLLMVGILFLHGLRLTTDSDTLTSRVLSQTNFVENHAGTPYSVSDIAQLKSYQDATAQAESKTQADAQVDMTIADGLAKILHLH